MHKHVLFCTALLIPLAAYADTPPIDNAALNITQNQADEIEISTTRLGESRTSLSSKTGGSVYRFSSDDIANLPQGDATPLNQVLLRAPGVVNDSFGQLHIRGDHGNTQYRINGVILPEGISGFGQMLDTRFAQSINLLTGALPAQYGNRTAGIIEITSKNNFAAGGKIDLVAGSNHTLNPSIEYGNSTDNLAYFVNGSYLSSDVGIEKPTPGNTPLHDNTQQYKGFGYLSYLLNPDTKLSFMFGAYNGKFQIPNRPGLTPDPNNLGILPQLGLSNYNSATLNDQQREMNRFAVSALQSALNDNIDYQVALFTRYSSVHYQPDVIGNLAFNGVASDVLRSNTSTGLQADASNRLSDAHTLRFGLFGSSENVRSDHIATVFPTSPTTGLVTGSAYTLVDNNPKNGNTLLGVYAQDEWRTSERMTLNFGARYDQVHAYVNEQQLSPRVAIVYKADTQTTWHAGYARYFTPPPTELVSTNTQALFQNTSNATPGQNSAIKSERAHYWDVGYARQLTPSTSLSVDSFYKQTQNLIDEGQFGSALIMTPYNYAQGKVYGIELSASYQADKVSGYANLARTISQAKNIISSQYLFDAATLNYAANNWVNVDHQQAVTASAGGSYLLANTRLSSDVILQSGLRNGFANTTSLPSYALLNIGASRKFLLADLGAIEARLVCNNLLDKVYEIRDGSGIGVRAPQFGARRGIYAGMSKSF
jgi:outer membrane receptor protein involved in Fe transport